MSCAQKLMRRTWHSEACENRAGKFIFAVIWRCTIGLNRVLLNVAVQSGKKTARDGRRSCIFFAPEKREFLYSIAVHGAAHASIAAAQRSRGFFEYRQSLGRSNGDLNCEIRIKTIVAIKQLRIATLTTRDRCA